MLAWPTGRRRIMQLMPREGAWCAGQAKLGFWVIFKPFSWGVIKREASRTPDNLDEASRPQVWQSFGGL